MLAQINPLPNTQIQRAVSDGNIDTRPQQAGFQMRGHIVAAFVVMRIIWFIFRHGMVKKTFEILVHTGIGIFIDGQIR